MTFKQYVTLFLLLCNINLLLGTTYIGTVTDSVTKETLPAASIRIQNSDYGTTTDNNGKFRFNAVEGNTIIVEYLGYYPKTIRLSGKSTLNIKLAPTTQELSEVIVHGGKTKYSKKNNPAVNFIKRVINNKHNNSIEAEDYFQRKIYEKISLGIADMKIKENSKSGLQEIIKHSDSSVISHKPVLFVSLKEKSINQFYRKTPAIYKHIVTGINEQGIDNQIFPEDFISSYTDQFFKEIDIYKANISLAFKNFVGPLSPIAPDFYKFFIKDTIIIDGYKCINIAFAPMNNATFGFLGEIAVIDTTLAVKQVTLRIHENTAINYLDGLQITQYFEENSDSIMQITNEQIAAEFFIIKGTKGIYAERSRFYSDYKFNVANDSILKSIQGNEWVLENAEKVDSTFWEANRKDTLKINENKVEALVATLQKNPGTKAVLFIAELFIKGYQRTSKTSYFDIGPIYSFFSGNTIEGFRLKLAGETTANLCPYVFLSGYGAYGFKDEKFKYGGTAEFSFNKKKYHAREYPVHSITMSYINDIQTLGEKPVGTLADNLFYSIKRMPITNMMYYNNLNIKYEYELRGGFSLKLTGKYEEQRPIGTITFQCQTTNSTSDIPEYESLDHLRSNEIGLILRYAYNEQFIQGRIYRFNIKSPYPVFELSHRASFQGLWDTNYGYQITEFKYQQRYFISAFGRIDILLKAGKIWTGNVAYPYLFTPNANTSFTVMDDSYSQINPFEFVADQYASIDISLNTNGLLFNLLPGIKKMKLREVVGFKCYWGYLSDKNNPATTSNLLMFPTNTTPIDPNMPYMEFNVGIDNIFSILRIDYVRRINYLNRPDVMPNGVRVSLNFTF